MRARMLVVCVMWAVACGSDAAGPDDGLPPDSARGEGLLLPWSELSGRITYATATELRHVDAVQRSVRVIRTIGASESVVDLDAAPTGNQLAVLSLIAGGGSRVTLIDVANGAATRFIDRADCPRFMNDGRISYLLGDTLYVEGAALVTLPLVWSCPTWSADGSYFIVALRAGATGSRLYRVDAQTRDALAITEPPAEGAWFDPVLLHGMPRLAFVQASDGAANRIFVANADGTGRMQVAQAGRLFGLDWAPDGAKLLGVSTAGQETGLFVVRIADGAVQKLAAAPVFAATWGP